MAIFLLLNQDASPTVTQGLVQYGFESSLVSYLKIDNNLNPVNHKFFPLESQPH
jgi:hypothetical protein